MGREGEGPLTSRPEECFARRWHDASSGKATTLEPGSCAVTGGRWRRQTRGRWHEDI